MRKKSLTIIALVFLFVSLGCKAEEKNILLKTPDDARKIGQLIAEIVYGRDRSEKQQPYIAELNGDFWVVRGTLHSEKGGVVEVEINKFDGAILKISHGK